MIHLFGWKYPSHDARDYMLIVSLTWYRYDSLSCIFTGRIIVSSVQLYTDGASLWPNETTKSQHKSVANGNTYPYNMLRAKCQIWNIRVYSNSLCKQIIPLIPSSTSFAPYRLYHFYEGINILHISGPRNVRSLQQSGKPHKSTPSLWLIVSHKVPILLEKFISKLIAFLHAKMQIIPLFSFLSFL